MKPRVCGVCVCVTAGIVDWIAALKETPMYNTLIEGLQVQQTGRRKVSSLLHTRPVVYTTVAMLQGKDEDKMKTHICVYITNYLHFSLCF